MLKTPNTADKIRLMKNFKHEEEAFEEQLIKYEKNSCGRRCKVLLFYGTLIGMFIILCWSILLIWKSHMGHLGSNKILSVFATNEIHVMQKRDLTEVNGETVVTPRIVNENVYRQNKRFPQIAAGLQSKNRIFYKNKDNQLHEDENALLTEDLHEHSRDFDKTLEKIIEMEQIGSKTKNLQDNSNDIENLDKLIENEQLGSIANKNSYVKNQETKHIIDIIKIMDHQSSEEKDKHIINNNNNLLKNKYLRPSSDIDSNLITTIRKNMHKIYHLTGKNKNLSLGIYCGIVVVCVILLAIPLGLIIVFLYKFIHVRMMSKHTRLIDQGYEINKRRNPLWVSPSTPGTPINKDLRFTIDRKKYDMFCDIYD